MGTETDIKLMAIHQKLDAKIDVLAALSTAHAVTASEHAETRRDLMDCVNTVRALADSIHVFKDLVEKNHQEHISKLAATSDVALYNKTRLDNMFGKLESFKLNMFRLMWYGLVSGVLVMIGDIKNIGEWVKAFFLRL